MNYNEIRKDMEILATTIPRSAIILRNSFNKLLSNMPDDKSQLSDGHHTFEELYNHRMILTLIICLQNPSLCWKSLYHHDGTMFKDSFIVGFNTPEGNFSYHYDMKYWDAFKISELPSAPEFDGHTSDDVVRLLSLVNLKGA